MIDGPCKLVVASEMRPERADDIAVWYVTVHRPDLLNVPGFLSAEIMRDEAGSRFVATYDLETEAVLSSEELKAVRGFGPYADDVVSIQRWVVKQIPSG